jgi:MYXO-CTERM domain-containing protein
MRSVNRHRPFTATTRTVITLGTVITLAGLGWLGPGVAMAAPITESNLEAFLTFDEGSGSTTADLTGNGHTGTLVSASWGNGHFSCDGEGQVVQVATGPALQSPSFTYDLWFEADSSTGVYGRLMAQANQSGGSGPDVLDNYGSVAIRITSSSNAVFATPTVGSLSTPAPPNHFGICDGGFHREAGPEHVVVTHDEPSKTVRIFIGLESAPLRLCFEAVYTGTYGTDTGPLGLCNHPDPDHVFRGKYYQFAYYSRPLTYQVDSDQNVTGGEIFDYHQAGSAAELSVAPEPDAGVPENDAGTAPELDAEPDAAVDVADAAPAPGDALPDGEPPPSDPGAMGGCGCSLGLASPPGTLPVGLPMALFLGLLGGLARRRRRRQRR